MKSRVLVSTPLKPLAHEMSSLVERCTEFLVASAFISRSAVDEVIHRAAERKASVSVLTGTFSNSTRKVTFKKLLKLHNTGEAKTKIWSCALHRNFHAKLYIWKLSDGRGVAWIGSSNFTEGGLQNEGEIVLELSGGWDAAHLVKLRKAFAAEWKRGSELTDDFVKRYEQAERVAPGFGVQRRRKKSVHKPSGTNGVAGLRYFTANAAQNVEDGSPTDEKVKRLLGTADAWLHYWAKGLGKLRAGDRCVFVDLPSKRAALVEVTDYAREGKASVFSYEPIFTRSGWVAWNAAMRKRITTASGFKGRGKALGYRWLTPSQARDILRAMYPTRRSLAV